MKKKEVIEQLLSKGFTEEQLKGLPVKELRDLLYQEVLGNESVQALTTVLPEENGLPIQEVVLETITEAKQLEKPGINDKGWTQYVMSLFDDDELEGDSPRLEGLRRVTGQLFGCIREEGCDLIMSPNQDNGYRACAKAWVVIFNGFEELRFEALADACSENCSGDFVIYPTAIADTRAKARCYRDALRLKKIVAAEEKCGEVDMSTTNQEVIHVGQISAIELLSKRFNKDALGLANELFPGKDIKSIKTLDFSQAQSVIKKLHEISQAKTKS